MVENPTRLVDWFRDLGAPVVVAFSGGVDSSVVACAASRSGVEATAVTARSPSVAQWQRDLASDVAAAIGIEHLWVATDEWERREYQRNDSDRCFHCKESLYRFLRRIASERGATIVSGTNADDLGDYRPGIEAGRQAEARMPLAELGLKKSDVRELAHHWNLTNADLPASPCLASRIAYGVEVTTDRLRRIEQAEGWLRQHGLDDLRIRLHADELARIEVPNNRLPDVLRLAAEADLVVQLKQMGFRYISLDLEGLRTGSLNDVLVSLSLPKPASLAAP
ncbi:MAG: ATP-dependent sacrificial sulfur transferase LarE [Planctomycetota bacterium]